MPEVTGASPVSSANNASRAGSPADGAERDEDVTGPYHARTAASFWTAAARSASPRQR